MKLPEIRKIAWVEENSSVAQQVIIILFNYLFF